MSCLPKADVVIVIDSAMPWMPRNIQPRKDAKIIHISADPLETRYPFRELEADLYVAGSSLAAIAMLRRTLADAMKGKKAAIESRRKALAATREEIVAKRMKFIDTVKDQTPIHPAWLAACVNQVKSEDAIVISELGVPLPFLDLTKPQTYMGSLLSGGLGFGMGAGARRQARGARARGDRHGRRRLLHVRQPDPVSLRRPRREPADAHGRRQQSDLAGGAAVDARRLPGGPCRQGQHHAADRAASRRPTTRRWSKCVAATARRSKARRTCCPALRRGMEAVRAGTPTTLNVLTQARR